jgi:hypothetical protein
MVGPMKKRLANGATILVILKIGLWSGFDRSYEAATLGPDATPVAKARMLN